MKCFYHPATDAVGMCRQCGKTACRDCIADVGGALLCKGCMVLKLQHREDRREAVAASREASVIAAISTARRRISMSHMVFAWAAGVFLVFSSLGALVSLFDPKAPPFLLLLITVPIGTVFMGYIVWSCYWCVPLVWRAWWNLFRGFGCFLIANPLTLLFLMVAFFEIPLVVGYMYGVFGGGIYEYRKAKRIAGDGLKSLSIAAG